MYDYVIIGAGSAGCVLAARLSEDPDITVLVLEAGPAEDNLETPIPAALSFLHQGDRDWNYHTVTQERAAGRRVYWPRGRALGGSSAVNAMIYTRGHPVDYDTWRDAYGCTGWGYADLLPYFKRSQDQRRGASAYHGTGGPLRVEDPRYQHKLTRAWVRAAQEYGIPENDDFNGPSQDGVGFYQVTQRRGRRWSAADAYLRPALSRPNITVRANALATRVLFDRGRAVGVTYLHRGTEQVARAEREVILAGGAVNSPQLLMLSGVGPAAHLREFGLDVVADLPDVGANLQDHPLCVMLWHTPRVPNLWEQATRRKLLLWQLSGRGPFASNLVEAGAFVRARPDAPAPDLRFHVLPVPYLDQGLVDPTMRMVSVFVSAIAASSRGRLTLRSADPRWHPAIDPGYLTAETDLELLLAGIRQAREIATREPFAGMVAGEHAPGPDLADDTGLRAWIRRNVVTLFHPTSTCAMGGDSGVCDPELKVRGVRGLRVVDASVMPQVPRADTNAPTIALAERAADLILGRTPLSPDGAGLRSAPAPS